MKKLLLVLLSFAAVFLTAAELRIAVVNTERVFKEYYKSRIAEDFLTQQAEAARMYLGQLNSQLEALKTEARKLGTNALNPALKSEARAQAAQKADEAVAKVKAKETEISLYTNERMREIRRIEQEKRQEIISDIRKEIKRRAAAENYSFVLDNSGLTSSGLPAVLIYPEANDISTAVIRELNRTAAKKNSRR